MEKRCVHVSPNVFVHHVFCALQGLPMCMHTPIHSKMSNVYQTMSDNAIDWRRSRVSANVFTLTVNGCDHKQKCGCAPGDAFWVGSMPS